MDSRFIIAAYIICVGFAVVGFGIGAHSVAPTILEEKEIDWVTKPVVITHQDRQTCYLWHITHEWKATQKLEVCRQDALLLDRGW